MCGPKFHLGRPPRLSLRLLPLTAPLRICFVLYTFRHGADNLPTRTDKICPNHSYRVACHCSTTGDVALDAFNSKLFSSGTQSSSLCGSKLHIGQPPRLSLRLLPLTANSRLQTVTVIESVTCIQRPVAPYVVGGGWELFKQMSL